MEDTGITVVSGCLRSLPWQRSRLGTWRSHRVTSSHIESSEACNILVAPSWALPMAQAASVVRGRDGRDGRDGMVNSWSLARFVPVCLEVSRSFFQKEKKLPNFCPATYLVKVPEGSWSRSKHGKVWRFHMIWYIYIWIIHHMQTWQICEMLHRLRHFELSTERCWRAQDHPMDQHHQPKGQPKKNAKRMVTTISEALFRHDLS